MKQSMPEIVAMESLVFGLTDYLESLIESSTPDDSGLDEIKLLLNYLPIFMETCRKNVDFKIQEEPTAELMTKRMIALGELYGEYFKAIDTNSGIRMRLEICRASSIKHEY